MKDPQGDPQPLSYCLSLNALLFLISAGVSLAGALGTGATHWRELGLALCPPVGVFAFSQLLMLFIPGLWLAPGSRVHALTFPGLQAALMVAVGSMMRSTPYILMTYRDLTRTDLIWQSERLIGLTAAVQCLAALLYLSAWRRGAARRPGAAQ